MKQKVPASFAVMIFVVFAFWSAGPSVAQDTPEAESQTITPPEVNTPPPPMVPTRPVRPVPKFTGTLPEMAVDSEAVTMPLQYLDTEELRSFATSLGVNTFPDTSGENVILFGPAKAIAKVQEFMNLLDVPPAPEKNVLLTFYVVTTKKQSPEPGLQPDPQTTGKIQELLSTTLGISQFSVWDTLFLRTRDNESTSLAGFLPLVGDTTGNEAGPSSFQIQVGQVRVAKVKEEAYKIALDELQCAVELGVSAGSAPNAPPHFNRMSIGLKSNADILEGKMEMVGKTSISSKGDNVIVIVSAQVLKD